MSDEENQLIVCCIPHCDLPVNDACCTGRTPHYLCDSCFCTYASAECESVLGAFDQERVRNGPVSTPGELPCPLFPAGECDCSSIPMTTLARVLSTDSIALRKYEEAKRRLIQAQCDQEEERTAQAQEEARNSSSSPLERLWQEVVDALGRGGYVACPECGQHNQKDDEHDDCMHMRCSCGTRYCYCCGRPRSICHSDGTGCDATSAQLESYPGWGGFAINGESRAVGALHQFHKRRMAYFLRQVKATHSPTLWEDLSQAYPDILDNKPTDGRSIQWEEIDSATAPLFGRTTEDQLMWKNPTVVTTEQAANGPPEHQAANGPLDYHAENGPPERQAANEPSEQAPTNERQQSGQNANGPRGNEGTLACSLQGHHFALLWLFWFAVAILLIFLRRHFDSNALRIAGNSLIAALAATGLPSLAMVVIDSIAIDPDRPQEGRYPLTATPNEYRLFLSHGLCLGVAVGSLIVVSPIRKESVLGGQLSLLLRLWEVLYFFVASCKIYHRFDRVNDHRYL